VFDTRINQQLSFEEFWQGEKGVLARNGKRKFSSFKENVYVTTTGQEITFVMAPDSRVLTIANGPVPVQSTTDFATGTILQSSGTSGLVTIANPFTRTQITLDDRDPLNPVQTTGPVSGYAQDLTDRTLVSKVSYGARRFREITCVSRQAREARPSGITNLPPAVRPFHNCDGCKDRLRTRVTVSPPSGELSVV
jgi:hypothetical protein